MNTFQPSRQPQTGELQSTYRQLGQLDPSAYVKGVGDQNSSLLASGMASAAASRAAAMNRARRTGGQVAGSFAQNAAMIPFYNQASQNTNEAERYRQQALATRFGLQADIGGQLSGLRQRQQGMLADYGQGQQQFGLQERQLSQQGSQFGQQFGLQQRAFDEQKRQFDLQLQRQRNQDDLAGLGLALQYQPQRPAPYLMGNNGQPLSGSTTEGYTQLMQRMALQRRLQSVSGAGGY